MAKRAFGPDDAYRLRTASDPDVSPDGRRVAFVVTDSDREADRVCHSIWVVPADGSAPARRFTEGPDDKSPRWSPDGHWLAYVSNPDKVDEDAHVRLAPLDGGVPARLGEQPGPVLQFAWSADCKQLVVVCRVGALDRGEDAGPLKRNAPHVPRGLAARLDGVGWEDGRRHLFVVDVDTGSARQVTRGEYDHDDPSFSPDGASIAFASDRHPRRNDRQFRGDAWVIPAGGGRPRRLTHLEGGVAYPTFSPDGRLVALAGSATDRWDEDAHVFVVRADGGASPERVAPDLDRPTVTWAGLPSPLCWAGNRDLLMLIADRGSIKLHRARVGQRRSREVIGGDILIDGIAARPGRRTIAYTESWPDRPSELYATAGSGAEPTALTELNASLVSEVELGRVNRTTITRPDGTRVEYFTILPTGAAHGLPLHVDVHGGPHAAWPSGRWLPFHQSIVGAGYALLLPNPRGSASYGQEFTRACTGDWGGGDYEDILACCDDMIERGIVDGRRMFVSGGSYGGFMTGWIVGHTDRFRAATAVAAVVDQTSMALTTEIPEFALFHMGGRPWARRAEYELRSPLTYLPNVKTPVLVVHWEGDLRVPISQGDELWSGLRLLGKETEFVRYPGGFHIQRTPSQAVDWIGRMLAWNEQHDARPRRRARPV